MLAAGGDRPEPVPPHLSADDRASNAGSSYHHRAEYRWQDCVAQDAWVALMAQAGVPVRGGGGAAAVYERLRRYRRCAVDRAQPFELLGACGEPGPHLAGGLLQTRWCCWMSCWRTIRKRARRWQLRSLRTSSELKDWCCITTHLTSLKVYAANRAGVLNAAVGFDQLTLTPTYRTPLVVPGASAGLNIAERLGLRADILRGA